MTKATDNPTTNVVKTGGNVSQLKADIVDGIAKIEGEIENRQAANDAIAAVKSDLEAKGVPKKALNMAMQYMAMDSDKREGFDVAYGIVREAMGMPVVGQGDLFEDQNETTA